jgi:hypothetical protein
MPRPRLTPCSLAAEKLGVKRRTTKLLLALCALLALPALSPAAEAAPAKSEKGGSLLYVQESDGGTLQRLDSGGFRLRLSGVSPRVSTFTDRPRRRAGSERLRGFVGQWQANGFAADPPNAALVLDRAPRSRDVALLTLSHPHYDRGRETLSYRVTPLRGADAGALASFARRGDPLRPGEFGAASLFVDDGGAEFTEVTFEVNGASPTISLRAAPAQGGRVAWSLGPPGSSQFGLQINGSVQLTSFDLNESALTLTTEGETLGFTASLGLELEGTQSAYLSAAAAPGTVITATTATANGLETQQLGSSPTFFGGLATYDY